MSSGFVTESEIAEARRVRQAEWERVRTDDQPLEAPEETYDPRPLYQRLEEQKQKKDAEYEEAHKLKNMIRGLDDDEVGFLDLVERSKATAARQISLEEQREMQEFRERVSTLQEREESNRLAQQLSRPAPCKPSAGNTTRAKLQGVIVRKRKASDNDPEPTKNGVKSGKLAKLDGVDPAMNTADAGVNTADAGVNAADAGVNTADAGVNTADAGVNTADAGVNTADAGVNTADAGVKTSQTAVKTEGVNDSKVNGADAVEMKCVGVLPGLGHYDDDTSDSDNSSDSDECSPCKAYDLCGRIQEKKKDENKS